MRRPGGARACGRGVRYLLNTKAFFGIIMICFQCAHPTHRPASARTLLLLLLLLPLLPLLVLLPPPPLLLLLPPPLLPPPLVDCCCCRR